MMYIEGEEKYLKELDWVSIVKSIRELKALIRIILNNHQRQILAFERESIIPRDKLAEELESFHLHSKVPFDSANNAKQKKYYDEVSKIIQY